MDLSTRHRKLVAEAQKNSSMSKMEAQNPVNYAMQWPLTSFQAHLRPETPINTSPCPDSCAVILIGQRKYGNQSEVRHAEINEGLKTSTQEIPRVPRIDDVESNKNECETRGSERKLENLEKWIFKVKFDICGQGVPFKRQPAVCRPWRWKVE